MSKLRYYWRGGIIGCRGFSKLNVELTALIISLVAVVVGVIALLPLKYVPAKIVVDYDEVETTNLHYLGCNLYNMPIRNRLLVGLGIRREAAKDVIARFMIIESGTKRVVCPFIEVTMKKEEGVTARRITLEASLVAVGFVIIYFAKEEGIVRVCKKQKQVIGLGNYIARIEVLVGDKVHLAEHEFVVRDTYPFAEWGNY